MSAKRQRSKRPAPKPKRKPTRPTKKKSKKKVTKRSTAPRRASSADATIEFSTEATQQVPVAEVVGDIEEAMALDRLSEHDPR